MHTILLLAAVYGTLVGGDFRNAPSTVIYDNGVHVTAYIAETQANALGYKLLVDERPSCASNEYAVATGYDFDSVTSGMRIRRVYEKRTMPPTYRAWTPLTIMRGAKANGTWSAIKTVLEANDAYDEFMACQYCAECDTSFLGIRAIIVRQIGEAETATFLNSLKVEKVCTAEELLGGVR